MPKKKQKWFTKVRGSYLPASWQAWVLYLPFTLYLLVVLRSALDSENSPLQAFYIIFPQYVAAAVVMTWIAKQKS